MTKEDYMQLSKERLAELLVERDNEPCITSPQQIQPFFPGCFKDNGICEYDFLSAIRMGILVHTNNYKQIY